MCDDFCFYANNTIIATTTAAAAAATAAAAAVTIIIGSTMEWNKKKHLQQQQQVLSCVHLFELRQLMQNQTGNIKWPPIRVHRNSCADRSNITDTLLKCLSLWYCDVYFIYVENLSSINKSSKPFASYIYTTINQFYTIVHI